MAWEAAVWKKAWNRAWNRLWDQAWESTILASGESSVLEAALSASS